MIHLKKKKKKWWALRPADVFLVTIIKAPMGAERHIILEKGLVVARGMPISVDWGNGVCSSNSISNLGNHPPEIPCLCKTQTYCLYNMHLKDRTSASVLTIFQLCMATKISPPFQVQFSIERRCRVDLQCLVCSNAKHFVKYDCYCRLVLCSGDTIKLFVQPGDIVGFSVSESTKKTHQNQKCLSQYFLAFSACGSQPKTH